MINLKIRGRLGNQMFQYATALAIKEKLGCDENINVDFSSVYKSGFENELKLFKVKNLNEKKINLSIFQYIIILLHKIIWKFLPQEKYNLQKLEKFGLYYQIVGFRELKFYPKNKNILISGFFESSRFFDNIKPLLQKEFEPIEPELDKNKELYDAINNSESVCITIRRGDFLSSKYKDKFYVCDEAYFKKAFENIKELVNNPRFFVFSDDIDWCKKNIDFLPDGTMFESGVDPIYEKLRLMYSCKHFIISNSTFSWWAQYLSRNDNKIVIAPSKWYNIGNNEDIYEDNWVKIDV